MTNKEKYKDWILDNIEFLVDGFELAVRKKSGEPTLCGIDSDIRCDDCLMYDTKRSCYRNAFEWLVSEAEE